MTADEEETTTAGGILASVRRLEDDDVRAVFECLHEGKPPPRHLPFRIVPVGPNGLKLSPPSHEFPDGLFVLLRPASKGERNQAAPPPRAPSHLQHLVIREGDLRMDTCPWSLSGPQFPQPTAIQQRYCYPKGGEHYSSRKGGALWTMYRKDGKEDLTYRLLHVYYSAKRAVNKGGGPPTPTMDSPSKRLKALHGPGSSPHLPNSRASAHLSPLGGAGRRLSPPKPLTPPVHSYKSPAVTTAVTFRSSSSASEMYDSPSTSPPWLQRFPYRSDMYVRSDGGGSADGTFVSPSTPAAASGGRLHLPARRMGRGTLGRNGNVSGATAAARPARSYGMEPRNVDYSAKYYGGPVDDSGGSVYTLEPFPYDHPGDTGSVGAASDDMHWSEARDDDHDDPREAFLSGIVLKPSADSCDAWNDASHPFSAADGMAHGRGRGGNGPDDCLTARMMAFKLDAVHDTLREAIMGSPAPDRSALVSVLVHWARSVASDPLAEPVVSHQGSRLHRHDDDFDSLRGRHDGTKIAAV